MIVKRRIWIENITLFNKCVQDSGGAIVDIRETVTDSDGDVSVQVYYNEELSYAAEDRYLSERIYKTAIKKEEG